MSGHYGKSLRKSTLQCDKTSQNADSTENITMKNITQKAIA